jgi:NAD(P)-dependent dehydrogenase (short-subunit alcohol dehydrogenase family)
MMLENKVVVLTGAGGSLGSSLAHKILEEGAQGLALGDLDQARLDELTGELPERTLSAPVDVRSQDSVDTLVAAAMEEFGRVDVMINNAGVLSPNGRMHNLTDEDWRLAFDVNLLGAVHGVVAAVKVMRGHGGSIINTASVAGLTAWSYAAPYSATKAAVIHMTKVAAVEYAKDRIRVNCVCPGVFPSAMHSGLDDSVMDDLARRHPLGLGTPEDLLGAFMYLASDASSWTTGSALVVDGGYSAP